MTLISLHTRRPGVTDAEFFPTQLNLLVFEWYNMQGWTFAKGTYHDHGFLKRCHFASRLRPNAAVTDPERPTSSRYTNFLSTFPVVGRNITFKGGSLKRKLAIRNTSCRVRSSTRHPQHMRSACVSQQIKKGYYWVSPADSYFRTIIICAWCAKVPDPGVSYQSEKWTTPVRPHSLITNSQKGLQNGEELWNCVYIRFYSTHAPLLLGL